jgi:hypothetical protein
MVFRSLLLVFLTAVWIISPLIAAAEQHIQSRIFYKSKNDLMRLHSMHLDQVWQGSEYIEIVTDQQELDMIESLGYTTEIVHPDLGAFLRSRLPDKGMGAYKTLDEIYQYLDALIASYPSIVSQKTSIGTTYEGRNMWAVKISDNPNMDEDEPEVLYTAAIHAREVITPEVLFHFMDHLTQHYGIDPEVTGLVDTRELWFILIVNPDGYYHNEIMEPDGGGMWRKNRRDNGDGTYGVDLNRNFGYKWGYDDIGSSPDPADETYRGTGPFSEPETQSLRDFAESRNFIISVYYHSYSNLIIWPWGYESIYTPDNDIFACMGDSVSAMNGYNPGPIWILYPVNGDTDDWNYGEQTTKDKIFAITLEVGDYNDNFWPPLERIDDLVSENLEPNMFFARIAGNIYGLRPPAPPAITIESGSIPGSYTVVWTHDDTLNRAQTFELTEMTDYTVITDSADGFGIWQNSDFVLSSDRFSSPPSCFYSDAEDNVIHYMQSGYPYRVGPGDSLRFQTFYDIENSWDYAYVEVSTDGVHFSPVPGSITSGDNPHGTNRGHGITGSSGGWIEAVFDLNSFAGEYIYLRFSYYTDSYVTYEGFYVDDISPIGVFGVSDTIGPITDSAYLFSDKPENEYSYRVRARDDDQQWSAYSNVVDIDVLYTYVCGDADGNGTVIVADAVYVIDFIFKGGPTPAPLPAGDANGDGFVNVTDAVYVITYIFQAGPEPICP